MIKLTEKEKGYIAEFGPEAGKAIIEESRRLDEHCRINNITEHSINVDGSCNMGCC